MLFRSQLDSHHKNLSQLGSDGADARDIAERRNVMSTVFLTGVLDGDFQPKDEFLAVALHDAGFDSPECSGLRNALSWLNNAASFGRTQRHNFGRPVAMAQSTSKS